MFGGSVFLPIFRKNKHNYSVYWDKPWNAENDIEDLGQVQNSNA